MVTSDSKHEDTCSIDDMMNDCMNLIKYTKLAIDFVDIVEQTGIWHRSHHCFKVCIPHHFAVNSTRMTICTVSSIILNKYGIHIFLSNIRDMTNETTHSDELSLQYISHE
jgi:hypothetical protein